MQKRIPIYAPDIGEQERDNVLECLTSSWISSKGAFIPRFEREFADYLGAPFATSVSNGTVALHLALVALGIGPGDEVIVPTLTYIATANAVTYTGAKPVFCDCEPGTWQMSPPDVRAKITPRTRVIIAVHLYGAACDMDAICQIAREHNLFVVEDCAEAIGTLVDNRHVGTFGDIATFSFFGNKTITTGEGGMVASGNQTLHERAVHFKGQGLAEHRQYWHDVVGYNYRMTNICAAIGVAQLERVDKFVARKSEIAQRYRSSLSDLPITFQSEPAGTRHSHWMISFLLPDASQRDPLRGYLDDQGVETRPVFYPIHTMPMYARRFETHSVSEDVARRGINVPSWPGLTDSEIDFVCDLIRSFLKRPIQNQGRP
ncbi:MAG: DegT/DnrJ/EryC1/StrS family aminotransferase [Rhizobiaceae bacterium]